jgi:signal transduction histidine kinase
VAGRNATAVALALLLAGAAGLALVGGRAIGVERDAERLRAREGARRLVEREATLLERRLAAPLPEDDALPPTETWTLDPVPAGDPLAGASEDERLLLAEADFLIRARDDPAAAAALLRRLAARSPGTPLSHVAALRAGAAAIRAGEEAAARASLGEAAQAPDDLLDPQGVPVRVAALHHLVRLHPKDARARRGDPTWASAASALVDAAGSGGRLGRGESVDRADLLLALTDGEIPPLTGEDGTSLVEALGRAARGRRALRLLGGTELAADAEGVVSRRGDRVEWRSANDLARALAGGARVGLASAVPEGAAAQRLGAPLDRLAVWLPPDAGLGSGAGAGLLALVAGLGVYVVASALALLALRRAARTARMKEDFVAAVSHEMKTPIAAVQAMAEMLAQGRITGPERAREYAERMRAEMQRLGATVRNVLDAARIERGTGPLVAPRAIDPAGVVESVTGVVRPVFESRGFSFDVETRPARRPLAVDPDALTSVLVNLLDNAAKFSGEGRDVAVRAGPEPGGYRVEVLDRGPGVPAADRERVFERFFRGDGARRDAVPGIGLGLHVARSLVAAHGGSLRVEAREGGGSAFVLWLPEDVVRLPERRS